MKTKAKQMTLKKIIIFLLILTVAGCSQEREDSSQQRTIEDFKQTEGTSTSTPSHLEKKIDEIVRIAINQDTPSLDFKQIVAIFPKSCIANEDAQSIIGTKKIVCTDIPQAEISYVGGPNGILDINFKSGSSCHKIKTVVEKKFGAGDSSSGERISCRVSWVVHNADGSESYISVEQFKDLEETFFQYAAAQGP